MPFAPGCPGPPSRREADAPVPGPGPGALAALQHDPWYNKGTGFNKFERDVLGLRGLLPPEPKSFETQAERVLSEYTQGINEVAPGDHIVTHDHIRKWRLLQALQDRNETLFYRVLLDNIEEMSPIVYTPTVGWACQNFSTIYRRPRGMFFSLNDRGKFASMCWNWPSNDVDAIVVTDGSRILGLGDLGVNGLGISIGKLDMYVAAAGFHPDRVLPVVLDAGTDNEALRNNPYYLGLKEARIQGAEYFDFVDEFVAAVTARWPKVLLQFEDFRSEVAATLLDRYRDHHMVFNDDIQGTAATVLAGLYGALAVKGLPASAITQEKIVVAGAGSAGMGVVKQLAKGMERHGLTEAEANARFRIVDKDGLITPARADAEAHVKPFAAQCDPGMEGAALVDVIKEAKPTILIGLSAVGGLFKEAELRALAEGCDQPLVLPLSNPTQKLECTISQAARYTQGKCIYASGSPQEDIIYNDRTIKCSQANNLYVFPGLALGAHLAEAGYVSDEMLMAAAEVPPLHISEEARAGGAIYPRIRDMRDISGWIATAVILQADQEGRVKNPKCQRAIAKGRDAVFEWVRSKMYKPYYSQFVYLPPGVGE